MKAVISAIIARGATVTAEKVRQWIGAVYQYAAMLEITDRNPAAVLRGHFEQAKTDHRSALPREELTESKSSVEAVNILTRNYNLCCRRVWYILKGY